MVKGTIVIRINHCGSFIEKGDIIWRGGDDAEDGLY